MIKMMDMSGWQYINDKKYTVFLPKKVAMKDYLEQLSQGAWVKEAEEKTYVAPRQNTNECWFALIEKSLEEKLFRLAPNVPRIININQAGYLEKFFTNQNFYKVSLVIDIGEENSISDVYAETMSPEEISDFCRSWLKALDDFPEKNFSSVMPSPVQVEFLKSYFSSLCPKQK